MERKERKRKENNWPNNGQSRQQIIDSMNQCIEEVAQEIVGDQKKFIENIQHCGQVLNAKKNMSKRNKNGGDRL